MSLTHSHAALAKGRWHCSAGGIWFRFCLFFAVSLLPGCIVTIQVRRYGGEWHMLRFLIGKPGLFPDAVKELDELIAFLTEKVSVCIWMSGNCVDLENTVTERVSV